MLYDDSEQLEVRHVIALTHYDVSIYAGGDPIPEGELWIKRNCIRLTQRSQASNMPSDSKPFYIFSENCSEKEDFYHAMLQSLERRADDQHNPPVPLKFNTPDLVRLVQQLHASEENLHTRWINALIGRIFLAMYKTSEVERFLWTKITKKISRVPKPALISSIKLQRVSMGNLPPFITNPKLKELTVDGDLTVEADVSYKGNLCLEISAIARIELGSRFKAREVTLVLASILKSLEGHILVRIKPPPSNRIWITFEMAPKMEFSLEPIVSSRQITYGVILRAIESRIREVVNETLVLPNWDDMPFSDTLANHFRGGIWAGDTKEGIVGLPQPEDSYPAAPENESESEDLEPVATMGASDATRSMPNLKDSTTVHSRRPTTSATTKHSNEESTGISSATELRPVPKPKAMRSGSFASAATPIVNLNSANASESPSEERKRTHDATSAMKRTISRSRQTSPAESPVGSPSQHTLTPHRENRRSTSPTSFADRIQANDFEPSGITASSTFSSLSSSIPDSPTSVNGSSSNKSKHGSSMSLPRNAFGNPNTEKRQTFNQSLNTATGIAKKWLASRNQTQNPDLPPRSIPKSPSKTSIDDDIQEFLNGSPYTSQPQTPGSSTVRLNVNEEATVTPPLGSPAHPIGRGQPLPPPGTPLPHPPRPEKKTWSIPTATAFANLAKRKPVTKPLPSPQPQTQAQSTSSLAQAMNDSETMFQPSSSSPPASVHLSADRERLAGGDEVQSRRKPWTPTSTPSSDRAPPLPKRRQRMSSVTDAAIKKAIKEGQEQEKMFVVEAPPQEGSVPNSPTNSKEDGRGEDNLRDEEEGEENVFPRMDMDDVVT
jgi:hypothetical protein